jgi:hypothetical protein
MRMADLSVSKTTWTSRALMLGAILVSASGFGLAGISTCNTTAGTARRINASPFTTQSTGNGCSANGGIIDFDNFTTGTTTGGTPAIYATSGAPSLAIFNKWDGSGTGGGAWSFTSDVSGTVTESAWTYNVSASTASLNTVALLPAWSLSCTSGVGNCNTGLDYVTITMSFCLGATTTSGCSSANTGSIVAKIETNGSGNSGAIIFTCSVGGNGSCVGGSVGSSVHITSAVDTIAVSETLALTHTGNASISITNIGNEFTPEPSTFVMLSSALLGLGGLHYRGRKSGKKTPL